jgi:hypothetical protein
MWICTCCVCRVDVKIMVVKYNGSADLVCKNRDQKGVKSFESLLFDSAV